MNRRDVLKYTAYATGATIAAPLMASLLTGCQPDIANDSSDEFSPSFFSKDDFAVLKDMVDVILPKTDSPSATEVGVHHTIDSMLADVYSEADQKEYKEGWTALISHLNEAIGSESWSSIEEARKVDLLQSLETSTDEQLQKAIDTFKHLKQQTIAYYLTTKEIGTNYLNYLPVPGEYEPCIQLSEVGGKAWAI